MKLQNMTVIFIIIMIPIIIVTSYYIGLQIKTITMQKDYTVKLQTAAKDSIQALEINTVEWNSSSSNLADSKRRDVLAAINTFTTSLANSMGIGGAGKGRIQTYIPAIAYTMYDGYYIYSASKVDTQVTDENGLTQFDEDGNINTNGESYQYILKPYSPYSARYVNGSIDITVNYTLDNYMKVYGTVGTGTDNYVTKEGYLVVCDDDELGISNVSENSISGITYRKATIVPESLTEQVYTETTNAEGEVVGNVEVYPYIYDQYDNKQYWDSDENNYFTVNANNQKVYLQTAVAEGDANFSISNTFRKISVPQGSGTDWSVLKIFQILNPDGDYKFYYEDDRGAYVELPSSMGITGLPTDNDLNDYSAINYCVESYVFTKWVTNNLKDIEVSNLKSPADGQYHNVDTSAKIFGISESNNPDPENDDAYAKSVLAQHKKDVIINTLEKNLAQAQAQAQEMNPNYEYRLPQLTYDEWEQALSNISIIAYMQGMPIGLKYYNNYTIATSTLNKEYVDPDELYFAGTNDQYYHQRNCEKATDSDYVGYRSIDYVAKSYETTNSVTGEEQTNYYYPHDVSTDTNAELECYYCLVNRSTYSDTGTGNWTNNPYNSWTDSYYNALARERYKQTDDPGTYRPDVRITKTALASEVEFGEKITYEIKIKNYGLVEDKVVFLDDLAKGKLTDFEFVNSTYDDITNLEEVTVNDGTDTYEAVWYENFITLNAGQEIVLEYKAKPTGELDKTITNTAYLYSDTDRSTKRAQASAETKMKKTIKFASTVESTDNYNIIMVLDKSWSEAGQLESIRDATNQLVLKFEDKENVTIKYVTFANSATSVDTLNAWDMISVTGGTNYLSALIKAKDLKTTEGKNILVFMSDGCPTWTPFADWNELCDSLNWENGKKLQTSILLKWIPDTYDALSGVFNMVLGGWLELAWVGEDEYAFQLLVTGSIPWDDLIYSGITKPEINDKHFLYFLKLLAKNFSLASKEWSKIMKVRTDDLGDIDQFYTVYFHSSLDKYLSAAYGLQQMATGSNYYKEAENIDELNDAFEEIGNSIIPESKIEKKEIYRVNTIIVDAGIKSIKVGDSVFTPEIDFYYVVNDDGKWKLDISDWLNKDITIIY